MTRRVPHRPPVLSPVLFLTALFTGCLSPPMLGPHGATAAQGGPVVLLPRLVDGEKQTPLRSVLAWTGEEVRIRMPGDKPDLILVAYPGKETVRIEDPSSGKSVTGLYNQPLLLTSGGVSLELVAEYP